MYQKLEFASSKRCPEGESELYHHLLGIVKAKNLKKKSKKAKDKINQVILAKKKKSSHLNVYNLLSQ